MPPKAAKTKVTANDALPFVSVLTPTYNRRLFIPAAIRCFRNQTYPQDRMEWIILDDGTDKVKDLIDAANAAGPTNIRYYALPDGEKLPIGAKRNRVNELAKGDICVCWDDDDYYPPDRVRKAVTKLRSSPGHKVPVVGSSQLYLYFTDRDEIWSIGPYNPNHCTNGTMAYWRSYFKDHRYDDTAEKAEEAKFMDGWKTPVFQLTPEDTMLVLCHAYNTFDKRKLLEQKNPSMKKVAVKMRQLVKDKFLCDFYLGLARDYKEKDAAPAPAPAPVTEIPDIPQITVTDITT
jgi:glycosyltransferase involved in cell wall biosynthesis